MLTVCHCLIRHKTRQKNWRRAGGERRAGRDSILNYWSHIYLFLLLFEFLVSGRDAKLFTLSHRELPPSLLRLPLLFPFAGSLVSEMSDTSLAINAHKPFFAAGKAAFRLKGRSNFLRWGVPPPTQRTVRRGTPQIAIRVKAASRFR